MKRKILLIEDEEKVAESLKQVLELKSYEVTVKSDGREGLKAAKMQPDLIILDATLPGKSGYEIAIAIKSNLKLKPIPIILLFSVRFYDDTVLSEELNIEAYFEKPFDIQDLLKKVSHLLKEGSGEQ